MCARRSERWRPHCIKCQVGAFPSCALLTEPRPDLLNRSVVILRYHLWAALADHFPTAIRPAYESSVLFGRLFNIGKSAPDQPARRPSTGEDLVYAVGDIHGRLDLLAPLLERIRSDSKAQAVSRKPMIVFLGDYIDRGPQSKDVIESLLTLGEQDDFTVVTLKGNHEEQLLAFLDDWRAGPAWAEFGGGATMAAYGVEPVSDRSSSQKWERARMSLKDALPPTHLQFLQDLRLSFETEDYFFAHAGARPGVPLAEQTATDLLWIRNAFLDSDTPFEKVLVHGHTPAAAPVLGRHRIGIDTGAYATGILTALKLHGTHQSLLQVCTQTLKAAE